MKRIVLGAALAAGLLGGATAQEALRPEVGRPLAQAKSLFAAGNYGRALAAVNQADRARNKTPYENFVILEMRGAIAQRAGDVGTASRTYQALLESGRLPQSEQVKLLMAEASMAYQAKNYPAVIGWIQRYNKAGGAAPEMRTLLIQAYYLQGDYKNAAALQAQQIAAQRKAGQRPTEQQLQLLANSQEHLGDKTGFQNTMVQLVYFYPKPDYWQNLIHNAETKPGFERDRYTLDLDRLQLALGALTKPDDLVEMVELALQVPLPGEAKAIVDYGYAQHILGTGPEAARHERLRALVNKTYDERLKALGKDDADAANDRDGNRLLALGQEYVSFGKYDKGIPMMEQAIKKDQLRRPEDAKIQLGLAYYHAGNKARALQVLRTVGGKNGAADVAYLWILYIGKA